MKNTLLWSTLFALIGSQVHANITQSVTQPPPQTPGAMQPVPATPTPPGQNIPSINPAPAQGAPINCEYKIPPETKTIEQSLVMKWAANAVTQAFNFDPNNLDSQLKKLQPCFTEQGWTGFNTALQKSGNLEAIKSQKLTVSSQIFGQILMMSAKDNQWKITLPLQVVYQNDKEKVTQLLNVDVTISRKITGDLGISQMIAAPKGTVTQTRSTPSSTMKPSTGASPTPTPSTPGQSTSTPKTP